MKGKLLSLLLAVCLISSVLNGCSFSVNNEEILNTGAESGLPEESIAETEISDTEDYDYADEESGFDYEAYSPLNYEQAEKIAAMPKYSKDDTWAFYIYIVGSNLESAGLDELSELTRILISRDADAIDQKKRDENYAAMVEFIEEVTAKGADLPNCLYNPVEAEIDDFPGAYNEDDEEEPEEDTDETEEETEDSLDAESEDETEYDEYDEAAAEKEAFYEKYRGAASYNIAQMNAADFNDNTKVILQTGGARRWEDARINPNRSQRFLIDKDGMSKIYDSGVVNTGDKTQFADFLKYCTTNYPADHEVVFLWNHGSGFKGFGSDELYNDSLSLKNLEYAFLEAVGKRDYENPHFEAIGFDACLMASAEVCHYISGFAKYLYASEETEPGEGWNYTAVFNALFDDPEINGAQLGKVLADAFQEQCIDSYAKYEAVPASTFSVLDLSKTEAVYKAYGEFAKEALTNSLNDPKALSEISRAASSSVSYGGGYYKIYNTIDLGRFMEELPDKYDEQKEKVLQSISDCVLYSRNTLYTEGSKGISIYFPQYADPVGVIFAKQYMKDVSVDMDINALYYYKLAGCLNDEYTKYVKKAGYGDAPLIDYSVMNKFSSLPVDITGDGNMSIRLDDELLNLSQGVSLGVAKVDKITGELIYLGDDVYVDISEDGDISTFFDGKWISYAGIPLELEIVSSNSDSAIFKSQIVYNGRWAYMLTAYSAQEDELSLLGIGYKENEVTPDRNLMQPVPGDEIYIIRTCGNLYDSWTFYDYELVNVDEDTCLEELALEDGDYFENINLIDLRSDSYGSRVVAFTVSDGKITDQYVDEDAYVYNKD